MSALRLCAIVGVAWIRPTTSAVDEVCLVQKDIQREMPTFALSSTDFMSPVLLAASRWLNISQQDLIMGVKEINSLFRNKALVDEMYIGIQSTGTAVSNISLLIAQSAQNLTIETEKASPERALFVLESYLLRVDEAIAWLLASMALNIKQLLQALPAGPMRTTLFSSVPQLLELSNVTYITAYHFFDGTFRPSIKELFRGRNAFCKQYPGIKTNATLLDEFLGKALSTLQEAKTKISTIEPYITVFMPGTAAEFIRFMNTTLDINSKTSPAAVFSYHVMVEAMIEVAETKMGCLASNVTTHSTSKTNTEGEESLPFHRSLAPSAQPRAGCLLATAAAAFMAAFLVTP